MGKITTPTRRLVPAEAGCPDCDGRGWIEGAEPECCGRTYPSGACKGECVVQKQVQQQCEGCGGSGTIDAPMFKSDDLPDGFGSGPYGYLVMPPGLNEESWTLENDPITDKERADGYKCVALYAASPTSGKVTEAEVEKMLAATPFEDGDETVEQIIIKGLAASGFKLPSSAAPDVLRAALASLGLEVEGPALTAVEKEG